MSKLINPNGYTAGHNNSNGDNAAIWLGVVVIVVIIVAVATLPIWA